MQPEMIALMPKIGNNDFHFTINEFTFSHWDDENKRREHRAYKQDTEETKGSTIRSEHVFLKVVYRQFIIYRIL